MGAFVGLPTWVGTVPQWGLFLLLAIAVVRTSPQWLNTWSTLRLARSNHNADRIRDLERQVRECRVECDEKIAVLHNELYAIRTQRNAEQAALIRAILRSGDNPELKRQLELLESVELSLVPTIIE